MKRQELKSLLRKVGEYVSDQISKYLEDFNPNYYSTGRYFRLEIFLFCISLSEATIYEKVGFLRTVPKHN